MKNDKIIELSMVLEFIKERVGSKGWVSDETYVYILSQLDIVLQALDPYPGEQPLSGYIGVKTAQ